MTFVNAIPPESATGLTRELYEMARAAMKKDGWVDGYIHLARAWSPAPEAAQAWITSLAAAGNATGLNPSERELLICRIMYRLKSQYVLSNHACFLQPMTGWSYDELKGNIQNPEKSSLSARLKTLLRFADKVIKESHLT